MTRKGGSGNPANRFVLTPLIAAACLTASACGSGSAPAVTSVGPPPVITFAQATAVVKAYGVENNSVLKSNSVTANDKIEEGWAAEVDDFAYGNAQYQTSPNAAQTLTVDKIILPRWTAYPAVFLAEVTLVTPTASPAHNLFLFGRDSATAPWRLAAATVVFPNTPYPSFATTPDGYAELATASSNLATDETGASTQYADYMNAGLAGQASTTFADGSATSGSLTQLKQAMANTTTPAVFHFDPSSSNTPWQTPVFLLSDGSGLSIGAVKLTATYTGANGNELLQNSTRSNWGLALAPGSYSTITVEQLVVVAIQVPSKTSNPRKMSVVAVQGSDVSERGS